MSEHNDYESCAVIMCERRKATAVLRKIPPENLEQLINMWSDIAQGMIEKFKEEQKATEEKAAATKRFMEEHNITADEASRSSKISLVRPRKVNPLLEK